MLKKHSKFFESLLLLADWCALSVSWITAYYLRCYAEIIPVYKGIPPLKNYIILLIFMIPLWGIVFKTFGLYRPRRVSTKLSEIIDIVKASTFATLILISLTFLFRQDEFSRVIFLFFWIISIVFLCFIRVIFRKFLRFIRHKGFNQRYALVVGTEKLGQELTGKLRKHLELGIQVAGFVSDDASIIGKKISGIEVIGKFSDIRDLITRHNIDIVFITLPFHSHYQLKEVLEHIGDEMVTIMVLPDLFDFVTLRGNVSEFEGMPLISLRDTPLYGWSVILKRTLDVVFAIIVLVVAAPIMLTIAIVIKLTSEGPVFYKQERMGLDGRLFNLLKFRTMCINAEEQTGPVWTKKNDPRCTKIGKFLRMASLDELPQFFNVLWGDMSIVGPRPERPVFIKNFRNTTPKYMLRHKMKAGITGWAQVCGFRGNTSLEKRIKYDLYYIEHWSMKFDLKIIWLTLWRGFINKHAY
ncbi:putative capsular polysaccharide synthesis protein [Candidatus Kuenenia stuttgartiensis]|uniref:Putative capsular polysaccharide synthesis protein n=1 Tax=Kuenenia stuttgartiensis TaxID=174633 RepID=Q1PWC3_KUEST|nr:MULTISPECIES: undecaprenyl-phosphate glucose phosphotransferase [Kuenenia]MBE7545935.1 undecaprenyl-phosphate glucose phosphotransferase [Planctomycetia bacterium]MCZ7562438.1 undecaprenyl-phosphate glucose phosphotransferase [Burkholderiales bacterium]MBZ0193006.1 undecaprenyl-phosphate glucose phosphotransferase [Candidatus Kuenenia stuttgartiensis]MCF6152694.1 undecaprenyl-phosphate glucose phosphotransferase [Candidatus Kuenenia stuttgartiensis]MCL4727104.1 undecaprenyl-phosphate glucos